MKTKLHKLETPLPFNQSIEVVITFRHWPAEPQYDDSPNYDEFIEFYSIMRGETDLYCDFSDHELAELETLCLESLKEDELTFCLENLKQDTL